jgi:hypothetical protein
MMEITCLNEAHGRNWSLYHGDTVEIARQMPSGCVDLALYSPPFSDLFCYSDSERDMGNNAGDAAFLEHYKFLAVEITRLLRPGRICAVHCKQLVDYKGRDGRAGLRDFRGELIRIHEAAGLKYHAETVIWKDPVIEMQRTKAHGLLYKQLRTDSTFSRMGMAEYMLFFRKWATPEEEALEAEVSPIVPVTHTREGFPLEQWQRWASPIWTDINQTRTLNVKQARDDKDEKHMCPLQLDVVERVVVLYSNPGETVYSPFAGIGSEGYGSIPLGRKFWGVELKQSYFESGVENLREAEGTQQMSLFGGLGAA